MPFNPYSILNSQCEYMFNSIYTVIELNTPLSDFWCSPFLLTKRTLGGETFVCGLGDSFMRVIVPQIMKIFSASLFILAMEW